MQPIALVAGTACGRKSLLHHRLHKSGWLPVKLIADFEGFLSNEVNLNPARITKLEKHIKSVEKFLDGSDWGPRIRRYSAQGSWAHKTIIKPPGDGGVDADFLEFIDPVGTW